MASTMRCISGIEETSLNALNTLNTRKTLNAPEDGAREITIITKSKLFQPSLKNFVP